MTGGRHAGEWVGADARGWGGVGKPAGGVWACGERVVGLRGFCIRSLRDA